MKKYLLLILGLSLVLVPSVGAQSDNAPNKRQEIRDRVEAKQDAREEKLAARDAKKCELVKSRLEAQLEKSDELITVRLAKYQRILDRLNALVLRLENNDLDATELKEVVTGASDLLSELETNYGQYTAELRNTANLSCVDDVDFKDTLQTTRSALRTARQDDRDVRDYLREEARTVVEAIIETNNGQPVDSSDDATDTDSSDVEPDNGDEPIDNETVEG